jgi:hypothetical protein
MTTRRLAQIIGRAMYCAVGIVPVTIAGIALMRCGCSTAAWVLEIGTGVLYLAWILRP